MRFAPPLPLLPQVGEVLSILSMRFTIICIGMILAGVLLTFKSLYEILECPPRPCGERMLTLSILSMRFIDVIAVGMVIIGTLLIAFNSLYEIHRQVWHKAGRLEETDFQFSL